MRRIGILGAPALLAAAACGPADTGQADLPPIPFAETGSIPAYTVRDRWRVERPLTYHVDDARGGEHRALDLAGSVERALDAWARQVQGESLTFEPSPDPLGADVVFSFEPSEHSGCPDFGKDTAVAHTGGLRPGTFVHFDAGHAWKDTAELDFAALHEVGHLYGLDHTEHAGSLMHVAAAPPEARMTEGERAGLASLYGGRLEDHPSDLWSRDSEGTECVLLWRAAPPGISDFLVFDADGDGRDEVVVWRTDVDGAGVLTLYFFDRQMRLERTIGPLWGAVVPGAEVTLSHLPSGHRVLTCVAEGQAPWKRGFDDECLLRGVIPEGKSPGERFATRSGDLNGDGEAETVFRR